MTGKMTAQGWSNRLAVGVDAAALFDPISPSFALTGAFATDINFSVDLTLGLPAPSPLDQTSSIVANWEDRFHRELALGINYELPKLRPLYRWLRGTTLRLELFELRQRYTVHDDFYRFTTTRRMDFGRARGFRHVEALRFGVGTRFEFGRRWAVDYFTLTGIRRTTFMYSEVEGGTITVTTGSAGGGVFSLFRADDGRQQGSRVIADFAVRVRLWYTIGEW